MYLLVDNFDSFTYNLYALFELAGAKLDVIKNNQFKKADKYQGIILSPGPSSPKNSGSTLEYLDKYTGKIPIFGVCLGMQAIGYSLGYEVSKAKTIMHGKADRMKHSSNTLLFQAIPQQFTAVRYHSLSVKIDNENVSARALSDNEVMAIEFPDKKLFGVQFHPESLLSEYGSQIAKNFMSYCTHLTKNKKG